VKRLASHESLAYLGHLKNLLEQADIACLIKNEQLSGGLGEIPFLECLPELWVLRDEQAERAHKLLTELQTAVADGPAWTCGQCGERNESQFGVCWQCGAADVNDAE
jgi:hypothetical protein